MLRNYIKIAIRNLRRNKGYSFINIAGLAIGMACCLLILLYVKDELSYDGFHQNKDRIYRILSFSTIGGTTRQFARHPSALSQALAEAIPEVEAFTRIFTFPNTRISYQNNTFEIRDFYIADESFFSIFSHDFIAGDPITALASPNSLVITKNTAIQIFGDEDPIGKSITFQAARIDDLKITGVIKNIPENSHYNFDMMLSSSTIPHNNENNDPGFLNQDYFFNSYGYLLLRENADVAEVENKIKAVVAQRWGEMLKQRGVAREYPLQSLKDIHLRSNYEAELGNPGNINYVYLFSAIALFVLFVACFNFINLSTAKSAKRAKEVGLRKVFGAFRNQLIKQFLSESIIMSLIGLILGVLIVIAVLPVFNNLTDKEFDSGLLTSHTAISGLLGIVLLTGVIAGSFPAFVLSAFHPIRTIRGKLGIGTKNMTLRKILVVIQFSISIFMITSILVILNQLDFLKNKDLGFNKDQMVIISAGGQRNDALRDRILQNPNVVSVSLPSNIPGGYSGDQSFYVEGTSPDESVRGSGFYVDYDYLKTFGMELLWGRNFSREFPTDVQQAVILNEKAVKDLGLGEDAVGKQLINIARNNRRQTIIGVVKDFHHKSLKLEINPVILALNLQGFRFISVRISPNNVSGTLSFLEGICKEINPEREFSYYFLDDDFKRKYPEEDKLQEVYLYFGFLAIFIACLGLYGLASFTIEQRTKEIGVRKILGAKVRGITFVLSKEFIKWVLLANIIAWPLAYYVMNDWLDTFAYRITIGFEVFFISGILATLIAVFTVSYQSIRAAHADPVESLRYE